MPFLPKSSRKKQRLRLPLRQRSNRTKRWCSRERNSLWSKPEAVSHHRYNCSTFSAMLSRRKSPNVKLPQNRSLSLHLPHFPRLPKAARRHTDWKTRTSCGGNRTRRKGCSSVPMRAYGTNISERVHCWLRTFKSECLSVIWRTTECSSP